VSRFKIIAVPLEEGQKTFYLNVRLDTLSQHGGSVPVLLANTSEEASVFEFTTDHNLRLYHSELLAGSDREFVNSQIVGHETRYSGLQFGWSPTARLSKYLVPQAFIIDMQVGRHGHQLRTIVNETYSTDIVGVGDGQIHLPVGERKAPDEKLEETKELTTFYRLEATELE
jgi:hypothetical protein